MTKEMAAGLILGIGVLTELICCIGVLVMPNAYSKLHYVSPASSVGAGLIALALLVNHPTSQSAWKAVLLALILTATNPVVSNATARAIRRREDAHLDDTDGGGSE